ncbi:MAG TPA: hypothetical protein VGL56_06190 [Fimbriimonadaceae bacterium]|jgi:hypothetical protein
MKIVYQLTFAVCLLAVASGCGQSPAVQGSSGGTVGQIGQGSPGVGMKAKLNAMSVPDRLAYLKQHPEAVRAISGGSTPIQMGGAKPAAGLPK